ncbi:hypothetical protein L204_100708 [Cryptococcus depauperatus]
MSHRLAINSERVVSTGKIRSRIGTGWRYVRGEKAGVREAEEKRRRKCIARINSAADSATADASFPPFPFSNANIGSSAPAPPGIGPGVHFPSSKSQQAQAQNARPMISSTKQHPSSVDVVTGQYRKSASHSADHMPSAGPLPLKQG